MTYAAGTLAVVGSAAAYAGTFPPWSHPWLAFVALVPFLRVLQRSSPRRAALVGFVWGTLCISFFGYWVPVGMSHYWEQPGWFGFLFALGVAMLYCGSVFTVFGVLYVRVAARWTGATRILLTAALYVACELARSHMLTGHPWLLLGYALVPYPTWIQMADLGGVYLLSFAVVVINAALVEVRYAPAPVRRPALVVLSLAVVGPLAYGGVRLHERFGAGAPVRVAIAQGNLDLGTQWRSEYFGAGLEEYLRLSQGVLAEHPRVVVWPEAAMTFFLTNEPSYLRVLVDFTRRSGIELVTGGPYFEPPARQGPYYNSAFLVDRTGVRARYDKMHLLPFAEYFPLRTIQLLRRHFERVRTFEPGTEMRLLPTAAGRAGVQLCFEAIFPELVRNQVRLGAEILLNLSNDAWLQSHAGGEQHLQMVQLRAVETRRWVVRSTTTGVSAFIDPHGIERGRIDPDHRGALVMPVQPGEGQTVYVRGGDVFAYACVMLALVAVIGAGRRSVS